MHVFSSTLCWRVAARQTPMITGSPADVTCKLGLANNLGAVAAGVHPSHTARSTTGIPRKVVCLCISRNTIAKLTPLRIQLVMRRAQATLQHDHVMMSITPHGQAITHLTQSCVPGRIWWGHAFKAKSLTDAWPTGPVFIEVMPRLVGAAENAKLATRIPAACALDLLLP